MSRPPDPETREAPSAPLAEAGGSRAARRSPALRGVVALGRARLRDASGGQFGLAMAAVITLGYAVVALVLRIEDGAMSLEGLLGSAARWLAWASAGPIALAAAHDRPAADQRDGIEALAAARGLSRVTLHSARSLSAMLEIARAIAVPSAALALLVALLSGSARLGFQHLAFGAATALFGAVAGVTLGGLAAASGQIAGPRGRTLFLALLLVPWALADVAGNAAWSIPGALEAFLSFVTQLEGGPVG